MRTLPDLLCKACGRALPGSGVPYCKDHWPWIDKDEVAALRFEVEGLREALAWYREYEATLARWRRNI